MLERQGSGSLRALGAQVDERIDGLRRMEIHLVEEIRSMFVIDGPDGPVDVTLRPRRPGDEDGAYGSESLMVVPHEHEHGAARIFLKLSDSSAAASSGPPRATRQLSGSRKKFFVRRPPRARTISSPPRAPRARPSHRRHGSYAPLAAATEAAPLLASSALVRGAPVRQPMALTLALRPRAPPACASDRKSGVRSWARSCSATSERRSCGSAVRRRRQSNARARMLQWHGSPTRAHALVPTTGHKARARAPKRALIRKFIVRSARCMRDSRGRLRCPLPQRGSAARAAARGQWPHMTSHGPT
eukprot:3039368-Prymnesium_polylepis.2